MGGLMTSNDDILLMLGRVEEGVKRIREDFQEEKQSAHESRSVIHRRLDEQRQQIHLLDKVVEISSGVDATLREEIKSLKETVEKNHDAVAPTLEEWKKMKTLGYGISGLIAFAGLTIGAVVTWASDGAVSALRHWLKIN
jgi:ferritin-like protein